MYNKPELVSLADVLTPSLTAPLASPVAGFSFPPPRALCPHPHRASTSNFPYPANSFKKLTRSRPPATPVGGGRALSERSRVAPAPPSADRRIAQSDVARSDKRKMRLAFAVGRAAATAASAAVPIGAVKGGCCSRFPLPLGGAAAASRPSGLFRVNGRETACAAGAGDAGPPGNAPRATLAVAA